MQQQDEVMTDADAYGDMLADPRDHNSAAPGDAGS